MKYKFVILPLMLFAFEASIFSYSYENEWVMVKNEDGITCYGRFVPGSQYKEIKGESMIDAPAELISSVMNDIPNLKSWVPRTIVSELIEKKDNSLVLYCELQAPWPISNRDYILEYRVKKTPESILHTIKALNHDKYPAYAPRAGRIRITDLEGSWRLLKKGGKTYSICEMRTDPAGYIPAFVVNRFSKEIAFDTLQGLKRAVKDPKYLKN
jgi:hypothetical protein